VAPLDVSLRKRLVSLLNTVRCNGQQAYSTAYLIGLGAPLSLITSWSVAWSSLDTKMKYYVGTSNDAKQQLKTYDVDFGLVNDGLSEEWVGQMSDAALMPMAAYAMAPGACLLRSFFVLLYLEQQLTHTLRPTPAAYNIPQLAGLELVLDFDTIARIYLNEITMWDDPRIQALNSAEVVAALPSQPIYVITQSVATGLTSLFTTVLNATVSDFAAQVGPARVVKCRSQIVMRWLTVVSLSLTHTLSLSLFQVGAGALVSFPVQNTTDNRSVEVTTDAMPSLRTITYSFAFWSVSDIRQVPAPLPWRRPGFR
jgi:hypothetical protein